MRILHVGDDFAALRPCGLTLYSDSLMQAQVAAGHEVSYVFSGRHYPKVRRPRLKRWRRNGVRMLELVNSPNNSHWERGTRYPLRDLEEPSGAAAFEAALRAADPEVVHVQELSGLPSSLLDRAKAHGVPLVMTLHDYKTVCAAVRLLDADGRRCLRTDVGEDCSRNCAGAPEGYAHLIDWTVDYELTRLKRSVPLAERIDFSALGPAIGTLKRIGARRASPEPTPTAPTTQVGAPPEDYQRRRDVNIARLNGCDRLVAPSARVAEVYAALGVEPGRLVVQRLTVPHLEKLRPHSVPGARKPLTFVTLGSCASRSKGSRVVLEAVQALERAGRGGDYRLRVLGHAEPAVQRELSPLPAVELLGPYEPHELDALLDSADVGIMPSIWEEVHGFVGIEMLAKGIPLIGNALGGIPEYVTPGETGWLNHSATGAGLADLMQTAIDDPAEVERMQRSVRERRPEVVRRMADHVAEVEALYAELVSAAASQAARIPSPVARRPGS